MPTVIQTQSSPLYILDANGGTDIQGILTLKGNAYYGLMTADASDDPAYDVKISSGGALNIEMGKASNGKYDYSSDDGFTGVFVNSNVNFIANAPVNIVVPQGDAIRANADATINLNSDGNYLKASNRVISSYGNVVINGKTTIECTSEAGQCRALTIGTGNIKKPVKLVNIPDNTFETVKLINVDLNAPIESSSGYGNVFLGDAFKKVTLGENGAILGVSKLHLSEPLEVRAGAQLKLGDGVCRKAGSSGSVSEELTMRPLDSAIGVHPFTEECR